MDVFDEADQLRQVPMLSKLEPSKLKLLAFTSEALSYKDGDYLFRAGEPSDSAYVILDGEVDILAQTESGEEVAVLTRGRDELIGEMAVLSNAPRSATLKARGAVKTLRIDNDTFLKLITENPAVALDVMRQLSGKLAEAHGQLEALESRVRKLRRGNGDS